MSVKSMLRIVKSLAEKKRKCYPSRTTKCQQNMDQQHQTYKKTMLKEGLVLLL